MGHVHLFTFYEDGLRLAAEKGGEEIERELGRAILDLALNPKLITEPTGETVRLSHKPLGAHGNCVKWVAAPHSSEETLFLWAGNCLRDLRQLEDESLKATQKLLEEEIGRRGSVQGPG